MLGDPDLHLGSGAGHYVQFGIGGKIQPTFLRNGADRNLAVAKIPKDETATGRPGQVIHLRPAIAYRRQCPGPCMDKSQYLPKGGRNPAVVIDRIIEREDGAGDDRHFQIGAIGIVEDIVLERQPDAGIETLTLRGGIGDVERVGVGTLRDLWRAPVRVFAPGHVTATEQALMVVAVTFVQVLQAGIDPRIAPPDIAAWHAVIGTAAVDIARAAKRQGAGLRHTDREMGIAKLAVVAALLPGLGDQVDQIIRPAARTGQRQGMRLQNETRVIARAVVIAFQR